MAGRKQTRARGATAAAAAGRTPTALVVLGLCVALVNLSDPFLNDPPSIHPAAVI
jgi:chromate transport protein ChrA